jgi:hypothetical protein
MAARMKTGRRLNPLIVVGVLCLFLLIPLFCASTRGPENYAADFMTALGKGDASKLAELSVIGKNTVDQRREKWSQTVSQSKYYRFTWRVTDVTNITPEKAAVSLQMRRNVGIKMGEDELKYELPMEKVDGKWMVIEDQMDRDIYPFLPRP